mmetsp:Transcript_73099/g.123170  ORF Transcript_73099/g.123170 Transcript_73099/m.123170 type:complete len:318 (+) Transcript_73099:2518-3471(+)
MCLRTQCPILHQLCCRGHRHGFHHHHTPECIVLQPNIVLLMNALRIIRELQNAHGHVVHEVELLRQVSPIFGGYHDGKWRVVHTADTRELVPAPEAILNVFGGFAEGQRLVVAVIDVLIQVLHHVCSQLVQGVLNLGVQIDKVLPVEVEPLPRLQLGLGGHGEIVHTDGVDLVQNILDQCNSLFHDDEILVNIALAVLASRNFMLSLFPNTQEGIDIGLIIHARKVACDHNVIPFLVFVVLFQREVHAQRKLCPNLGKLFGLFLQPLIFLLGSNLFVVAFLPIEFLLKDTLFLVSLEGLLGDFLAFVFKFLSFFGSP